MEIFSTDRGRDGFSMIQVITFTVHLIFIIMMSAPPQIIRHKIPDAGDPILSHLVYDTLLQQPQETNTLTRAFGSPQGNASLSRFRHHQKVLNYTDFYRPGGGNINSLLAHLNLCLPEL